MAMEGTAPGPAGTFDYTVTRSGNITEAASIAYHVTGVGENGAQASDFAGNAFPSGVVTFAPGVATATIHFATQPNSVLNGDRPFAVTLSADQTQANISFLDAVATGKIMDDECAIGFGLATVSHDEGDIGVAQFQISVNRLGYAGNESSAEWKFAPGSNGLTLADIAPDQDLLGNNGGWPSGTVTLLPGETSAVVSIGIVGNTVLEDNKPFTLTLSNASEGTILPGNGITVPGLSNVAHGLIVNDDSLFSVIPSDVAVSHAEGQGDQNYATGNFMTVTVQRTGSTVGEDWVKWTLTGSGTTPATSDDLGVDSALTTFNRADHSWIDLANLSGTMSASGSVDIPTSGYIRIAYDRSEYYSDSYGNQIPFDQFLLKQLSISGGTITSLGSVTNANYIADTTAVTSSNNQTIFTSDGTTIPDSDNGGHRITITGDASLAGMYFQVNGTDVWGNSISETIKGPDHGTVETTRYFGSVSSVVTVPASVAIGMLTDSYSGNWDWNTAYAYATPVPDGDGSFSMANAYYRFDSNSPVLGADNYASYYSGNSGIEVKVTITSEADLSGKTFVVHGGIAVGFADLYTGNHNLVTTGPDGNNVHLDVPSHIRAEQVAGISEEFDGSSSNARYFVISGYDENHLAITEQIAVHDFDPASIVDVSGGMQSENLIDPTVAGATPTTVGRVMLTSNDTDLSGVTFTITGTDINGHVITEVIGGPNRWELDTQSTVGTGKLFATVTSVVADQDFTGDLEIGTSVPVETTHLFSAVTGFVQVDSSGATLPFDTEGGRIQFTASKDIVMQGPDAGVAVSSEYLNYVSSIDVVSTPPVNAHVTIGIDTQANPDYQYHTLTLADVQKITGIDAGSFNSIYIDNYWTDQDLQYNEGTKAQPNWVSFWQSSVVENDGYIVSASEILAGKLRYQGSYIEISGQHVDQSGHYGYWFDDTAYPISDSLNFVANGSGSSSVSGAVHFDGEGYTNYNTGNPSIDSSSNVAYAIFKIDAPQATPAHPATLHFDVQEIGRSGIDVGSIGYSPLGTWSPDIATQHVNGDNLLMPSLTSPDHIHVLTLADLTASLDISPITTLTGVYIDYYDANNGTQLQFNEETATRPKWVDFNQSVLTNWDNYYYGSQFDYANMVSVEDVAAGRLRVVGSAAEIRYIYGYGVDADGNSTWSDSYTNVTAGDTHALSLSDFSQNGAYGTSHIQTVHIDGWNSSDDYTQLQVNIGTADQPNWISFYDYTSSDISRQDIIDGKLRYVGSDIHITDYLSLDNADDTPWMTSDLGSSSPDIATSSGSVALPGDGYIWVRFTNGALTANDGANQAWINSLYVDGGGTVQVIGQKSISDGVANTQSIGAGATHIDLNGSAVVHEPPHVDMRTGDNLIAIVSPTDGMLYVDSLYLDFAAKYTDGTSVNYNNNNWQYVDYTGQSGNYARSGMSAVMQFDGIDPNSVMQLTYWQNDNANNSNLVGRNITFAAGNLTALADYAYVQALGDTTTLSLADFNSSEYAFDPTHATSVYISDYWSGTLQYNEGTAIAPKWVEYWTHVQNLANENNDWNLSETISVQDIADGKLRYFGNSINLYGYVNTTDGEGNSHTTTAHATHVFSLQDFASNEITNIEAISSININSYWDNSYAGGGKLQFNEGTADAPNWVDLSTHRSNVESSLISAQDIQDGKLRSLGNYEIYAQANYVDDTSSDWSYLYPQEGSYFVGRSSTIAGNPLDNADPMFTHLVADHVAVSASTPDYVVGDGNTIIRQIGNARVTLSAETDLSGDTFVIHGFDANGFDLSETISGPANGTVATVAKFASVTGVELVSGSTDGTISVGHSIAFASPETLFAYASNAMPNTSVVVTGLDIAGNVITSTISGIPSDNMTSTNTAMKEILGIHVQNPTSGQLMFQAYVGDGYTPIPLDGERGTDGYIDLGGEERITISYTNGNDNASTESYRVTGLDASGNMIVETLHGISQNSTAITQQYFSKLLSVDVGPSPYMNGSDLSFSVGEIGHPIGQPENLSTYGGIIDLGIPTAVFNVDSKITFSSADDLSNRHFTITGYDAHGNAVTETVTGPAAGTTVVTTHAFEKVTDISVDGGSDTGSLKIGYSTVGGGLTDHFVVAGSGTALDPITGHSTNTMETSVQFDNSYQLPINSESDVLLYVNFHGHTPGSVNLHYNLSVQGAPGQDTLSLEYSLANPTLMQGTVHFLDGQSTATIEIPLQGNDAQSLDKTMQFALTTSSIGTAVVPDQRTSDMTIVNDDDTVWITHSQSVSHQEGNDPLSPTHYQFTVTRTTATDAKDVVWELAGIDEEGATANSADFVATTGTAHFAIGSLTATFNVDVIPNTMIEADKTFQVKLSDPLLGSGYEIRSGDSATVAAGTIVNDDVGVTISTDHANLAEGNNGTVIHTYTVTRTGDLNQATDLAFNVTGVDGDGALAADGGDFSGGTLPVGTLHFDATGVVGSQQTQTGTITITTVGNQFLSGDRAFAVNLTNGASDHADITTASASDMIVEDDPVSVTATLAGAIDVAHPLSHYEGTAGTDGNTGTTPFTYTLTRTGNLTHALSLNWTIGTQDGPDWVNAADFANGAYPSGVVTFAANSPTATVTVNVNADSQVELSNKFNLHLTASNAGSNVSAQDVLTTIVGDDTGYGVDASLTEFTEGNDGTSHTITFTLIRAGSNTVNAEDFTWHAATGPNSVNYDPATGSDFAANSDVLGTFNGMPSGTAHFDAGQESVQVTVNVPGNSDFSADKRFEVDMINSNSDQVAASPLVVVHNDDARVSVQEGSIAEGSSNAGLTTDLHYTFHREGNLTQTSTVDWAVQGFQSGSTFNRVTASDFTDGSGNPILPSGTITFNAGETDKTVTVHVAQDSTYEHDENVVVQLSNASVGTDINPDQASATATITNDDAGFSISSLVNSVTEGTTTQSNVMSPSFNYWLTDPTTAMTLGVDYVNLSYRVAWFGYTNETKTVHWHLEYAGQAGQVADASDFVGPTSGTLTFQGGVSTPQTVLVHVLSDRYAENNEAFQVVLDSPSLGSSIVPNAGSSSGMILTDDAGLTTTTNITQIHAEGLANLDGTPSVTPFQWTVHRTGDLSKDITFNWSVSGQGMYDPSLPDAHNADPSHAWDNWMPSASANDFQNLDNPGAYPSGTVTILAGQTDAVITVNVNGDNTLETSEGFNVAISRPVDSDGNAISDFSVNVNGNNSGYSRSEDGTQYLYGEIVRDEGLFGISNELNAADLAAAQTVAAGNGTALNSPTQNVSMLNIDSAKSEGDGGLVHHYFKVYRQFTTSGDATVNWSIADSYFNQLTDQTSYLFHPSGTQANMHVLSIADMQSHFDYTNSGAGSQLTSAQIQEITVDGFTGGNLIYNQGTIEVPNWQTVSNGDTFTVANIIDGRLAYTGASISLTAKAHVVDDAGQGYWTTDATFTNTLGGIDFASGQDTLGTYNGLPSGTATILDGQSYTIVDVVTVGNNVGADNKTFSLSIHDASPGSSIGNNSHSDGFIANDDPVFSIGMLDPSNSDFAYDHGSQVVHEGHSVTYRVYRSGDASQTATVDWQVAFPNAVISGTTANNYEASLADFDGLTSGTLSFGAGDTYKDITLTAKADGITESWAEMYAVQLKNAVITAGSTTKAAGISATLGEMESLIVDGDAPSSTVSVTSSVNNNGYEGSPGGITDTAITYTLHRTGDTSTANQIGWVLNYTYGYYTDHVNDQLGITGDTTAVRSSASYASGLASFGIGETDKTIVVNVNPDHAVTNNYDFAFTLVDGKSILDRPSDTLNSSGAYDTSSLNYGHDANNSAGLQLFDSNFVNSGYVPDSGSMLRDPTQYQTDTTIKNDDIQIQVGTSWNPYYGIYNDQILTYEGDNADPAQNPPLHVSLRRVGKLDTDVTVGYQIIANGSADGTEIVVGSGTFPLGAHTNPASGNGSYVYDMYLPVIIGNTDLGPNTNFTLRLTSSDANANFVGWGASAGDGGSGSVDYNVVIVNDDTTWSIAAGTPLIPQSSLPEGNTGTTLFTFTVTRPEQDIHGTHYMGDANVTWNVVDNSLGGFHFVNGTLPSGTAHFGNGETSKTFTIPVVADKSVSIDDTFSVVLTGANHGQIATDGTGSASSTITNNDTGISIANAQILEGNTGDTSTMAFTVTRTGDLNKVSTAHWVRNNLQTSAAEFGSGPSSGDIRFEIGDSTATINVAIAGNNEVQADQNFSMTLSSLVGISINPQNVLSATGTILNDDTVFSIAATGAPVLEGDATGQEFTITRTASTSQNQTVVWTVTGSGPFAADAANDFVVATDSVVFHSGEMTKTIHVQSNQNNLAEPDKGFKVTIAPGVGASSASFSDTTHSATGAILNDDAGLAVILAEPNVQEGSGTSTHQLAFTVHRSGSTIGTDAVTWTLTGAAVDNGDFGSNTSGTATFINGQEDALVTVNVVPNTVVNDGDRAYSIALSNPTNAQLITAQSTVSGSIINDESSVSIADTSGLEGDTGTSNIAFTVTRTGADSFASSVHWHVELVDGVDNATLADFGGSLPSGTLTLAAGASTTTLNIPVVGNSLLELDKAFHVVLDHSTDAGLTIAQPSAIGTILNDDDVMSVDNASTVLYEAEGTGSDTHSVTFTVHRTGSLTGTSTIDWQITAANGNNNGSGDFLDADGNVINSSVCGGSVSFADGEYQKDVTVQINPDSIAEGDEQFNFGLLNPGLGSTVSTTGTGSRNFVIQNDDFDQISVAANVAQQTEGNPGTDGDYKNYTFTLTRLDPTKVETVHWSVAGTGDYPLPGSAFYIDGQHTTDGTATFGIGDYTKLITIAVKTDTTGDFSRDFAIHIDNPTLVSGGGGLGLDGVTIAADAAASTVTNDDPAVHVELVSAADGTHNYTEGTGTGTLISFNVVRTGSSAGSASVDWSITGYGDNPTNALDWNGVFPSGSVRFADGETSKLVQARINGDNVYEQDEGFQVVLSHGVGATAVNPGVDDSHALSTGVVVNDDNGVWVSSDTSSMVEGDSGVTYQTFTITARGVVGQHITVNAVIEGSGANQANSNVVGEIGTTLSPIMLTIGSDGTASETIDASIYGNTTIGLDETFRMRIASATNATILQSTAEVTVTNDDSLVSIDPTMTHTYLIPDNGPVIYEFTVHRTGDLSREAVVGYHSTFDAYDNPETGTVYGSSGTVVFDVGSDMATVQMAKFLSDSEAPANYQLQLDQLSPYDVNGDQNAAAIDPNHSYAQVFGQTSVTLYGGDAATGGSGDVLFGSDANDTIYVSNQDIAGGAAVAVFANGGNDMIHVDATNLAAVSGGQLFYIDGGAGIDTVKFDVSNLTIDLSFATSSTVANIEKLDAGEAGNTLMLNLSQLLNQNTDTFTVTGTGNNLGQGTHQLMVDGGNGDTVQIDLSSGAGWHAGADWNYGGHTYHVYNNIDQHVQLMLEDTLSRPS